MSAVYLPVSSDDSELCQPVDHGDFETARSTLSGAPVGKYWSPLSVELIREDEGQLLTQSDSPWFGTCALIFRRPALDTLGPMLRQYGELLPLRCDNADLLIYNTTYVIDALDEAASDLLRFDDGAIMMIRQYVFLETLVQGADIFKISSLRVSPVFVGDGFVNLWRAAGLHGLEFKELWRSD